MSDPSVHSDSHQRNTTNGGDQISSYQNTAIPTVTRRLSQLNNDNTTRISFSDENHDDDPKVGGGGGGTAQRHPIPQEDSLRQVIGKGMHTVSDIINDNIIAARYATVASIVLLSAYGISRTPLFFRYKTVSEIPGEYNTCCSLHAEGFNFKLLFVHTDVYNICHDVSK